MAPGLLIDKRIFFAILYVLVRLFQPCLMFASKARAYLSGTPLKGRLLSFTANIGRGRKSRSGTNTLAYWVHP